MTELPATPLPAATAAAAASPAAALAGQDAASASGAEPFAPILAAALAGADSAALTAQSAHFPAGAGDPSPAANPDAISEATPAAIAPGIEITSLLAAAALAPALCAKAQGAEDATAEDVCGARSGAHAVRVPAGGETATSAKNAAAQTGGETATGAKNAAAQTAAAMASREHIASPPATPAQTAAPVGGEPAEAVGPQLTELGFALPAPEPGARAAPAPVPAPAQSIAPAALPSAQAPLRPAAEGFAQEFASRVQLEIAAGRGAARIEVNPPELGPVELRIRVADGEAHLACAAPQAAVREAIQDALPRLREMLAAQGLALGQTSVGAELPGRESGPGRAAERGAGEPAPGERPSAQPPALAVPRRSLVDVFA